MKKLNYSKLINTLNLEEVGELPQITGWSGPVSELDAIDIRKILEDSSVFCKYDGFLLGWDAKLTNYLDCALINRVGFAVDNKLKKLLERYSLPQHAFYDLKIEDVDIPYYLFHALDSTQLYEDINFEKSIFEYFQSKKIGVQGTVQLNSFNQWFTKRAELQENLSPAGRVSIEIRKLNLKQGTVVPDLIRLPGTVGYYISEPLKQKLLDERITGVDFEESDIEFWQAE